MLCTHDCYVSVAVRRSCSVNYSENVCSHLHCISTATTQIRRSILFANRLDRAVWIFIWFRRRRRRRCCELAESPWRRILWNNMPSLEWMLSICKILFYSITFNYLCKKKILRYITVTDCIYNSYSSSFVLYSKKKY